MISFFTVPTLCTHPAVDEKVWNRASTASFIADRGRTPLHITALRGLREGIAQIEMSKTA